MNLRKLFCMKTAQEKLENYRNLKLELGKLDSIGQELSDKFSIQKSVIDGVDGLPEKKKSEVYDRYREFLKEHQKEVTSAVNQRNKILKSLENYRNDKEIGAACREIDALDGYVEAYWEGKISKSVYFDIVKSITGEPIKYADVIALDKFGRVLILHRTEDFCPTGKVCLPGGHVDPGEDFEVAALRELKEETNLDPILDKGIVYLGEHKDDNAHIKYYQIHVDDLQPVTVDAGEHCFFEFVDISELALKPFIFNQGRTALDLMLKPQKFDAVQPLLKALDQGQIASDVFAPVFTSIIKKAMDIDAAKPLEPESMEGSKIKLVVPVRDPMRGVENIMKGISGDQEVTIGKNNPLKFLKPLIIHDTRYREDPSNNRLTECEIVFTGDNTDMIRLLEEMKYSLMAGPMNIRTPHDEFMVANERGTDYIGDPIFVTF